jgi:hypothetical protein
MAMSVTGPMLEHDFTLAEIVRRLVEAFQPRYGTGWSEQWTTCARPSMI